MDIKSSSFRSPLLNLTDDNLQRVCGLLTVADLCRLEQVSQELADRVGKLGWQRCHYDHPHQILHRPLPRGMAPGLGYRTLIREKYIYRSAPDIMHASAALQREAHIACMKPIKGPPFAMGPVQERATFLATNGFVEEAQKVRHLVEIQVSLAKAKTSEELVRALERGAVAERSSLNKAAAWGDAGLFIRLVATLPPPPTAARRWGGLLDNRLLTTIIAHPALSTDAILQCIAALVEAGFSTQWMSCYVALRRVPLQHWPALLNGFAKLKIPWRDNHGGPPIIVSLLNATFSDEPVQHSPALIHACVEALQRAGADLAAPLWQGRPVLDCALGFISGEFPGKEPLFSRTCPKALRIQALLRALLQAGVPLDLDSHWGARELHPVDRDMLRSIAATCTAAQIK